MANLDLLAPTQKERLIAGISHLFVLIPFLGFIAPRIIYTTQKDKSQYIAFQSSQAFIYQLITLAVWLIGMALFYVLPIFWIWSIFVVSGINLIVRFIFAAYGVFGAVMAFQGKPFHYSIIGNRLGLSLPAIMNRQWLAQFVKAQKHPVFPFAVGVVVAFIHFVITNLLETPNYGSFGYAIFPILLSPSYAPLILRFALPSVSKFINSSTEIPLIVSSLFYGIMAGFLASRNVYLHSIGIILVFILILSGCFLGMLFAQFFA